MIRRKKAPELIFVVLIFVTALEKFLSSLVCAGITFTVTYGKLVLENSCLVNGKREKEPCHLSIVVSTYERTLIRLSRPST